MAAAYTADNLCTKQGNVGLKSTAYKWERLQIKSGLWWRAYGKCKIAGSNFVCALWNDVNYTEYRYIPSKFVGVEYVNIDFSFNYNLIYNLAKPPR